jgi:hypothetical protein
MILSYVREYLTRAYYIHAALSKGLHASNHRPQAVKPSKTNRRYMIYASSLADATIR